MTTVPEWREEAIAKRHDREHFDCRDDALNVFLRNFARQSHERGGSKTFVAVDAAAGKTVFGYYSLSPASLQFSRLPSTMTRGLGQYDVGAFKLVRLATAFEWQGQGLGGQLLLAAGRRCLRAAEEVGGTILLIDAKNERAANWYESYGAEPLKDAPLTLVLTLKTIEVALNAARRL